MRHWTVLLGTMVVLTGCSVGGAPAEQADRDIEATDATLALDVPDGWRATPEETQPPVVLAARGPTESDQVIVSLVEGEGGAEQHAVVAALTLADSHDVVCERLEDTEISDGPVFDCPDRTRRPWVHKVLVPIVGEGVSALLLVQARADSFDEATAVIGPMTESFVWR